MDVRQKQNLLQYLRYYEGDVDGINGSLTERAIAEFRTDNGNPNLGDELEEVLIGAVFHSRFKGKDTDATTTDFWSTVKYFRREEFACKCGRYCNGFPVEPNMLLIEQADAVREHFGAPCFVSSGVRCNQHNANVGGASGSRHKQGKAMDFRIEGKNANAVLKYVKTLPNIRYAYAIDGSYVHMDVY